MRPRSDTGERRPHGQGAGVEFLTEMIRWRESPLVVATLFLASASTAGILLEHATTTATGRGAVESAAATAATTATATAIATTTTAAAAATAIATATAAATAAAAAAIATATATAAAAAAETTTTTAAAAALFARPGFIDGQGTPTEVSAVQGADRRSSSVIVHLDEAETARPTGLAIGHHVHAMDFPVRGKVIANFFFGGREGQVPDVDADHDRLNPRSRPFCRWTPRDLGPIAEEESPVVRRLPKYYQESSQFHTLVHPLAPTGAIN